jgi:uncharacterized membrane protein
MDKGRLEAFSDGVIAILITIMVLELRAPHGTEWQALREVVPGLLTYVMSFVYLAIYWNNHHHMLCMMDRVNGRILWANMHLLFWLSLVPFATGWLGEHHGASVPTAVYGMPLLLAAIAYTILEKCIIADQGPQSKLAAAVGREIKGKVSMGLYIVAIPLAFVRPWIADAIYATVALMWLVPDPRIESRLRS